MIDKKLLKSKMTLYGDDQNALAEALGITIQRLSAKMNAKQVSEKVKPAAFTLQEVRIITERYKLTPVEIVQIFLPGYTWEDEAAVVDFMNPPEPNE